MPFIAPPTLAKILRADKPRLPRRVNRGERRPHAGKFFHLWQSAAGG
jgi:hypothetical protein